MLNNNITSRYTVSWWLWNGSTFERHELEVESVEIAKCAKYRFFRVVNPVRNPPPGREWIIAEGGTAYVLAYGSDAQSVLTAARGRFQFDKEGIRPADVGCYIQSHLNLLERYAGHFPAFVLPVVGAGIRAVLEPGEILAAQMI